MTTYLYDDFETPGDTTFHGRSPVTGWGGYTWQSQGGYDDTRVSGGRVYRTPSAATFYAGIGDDSLSSSAGVKDIVSETVVQFPDASAVESSFTGVVLSAGWSGAGASWVWMETAFGSPLDGAAKYSTCRIHAYGSSGAIVDSTVTIPPIDPLSVVTVRIEVSDHLQEVYVDDVLVHSTTADMSMRSGFCFYEASSNNPDYTDADETIDWVEAQLLSVEVRDLGPAPAPDPAAFWTVFRGRSHEDI